MWRFIALATVIVAVIGAIAFARRGGPPDLRISAKVGGTPTPTAERLAAESTASPPAVFSASGSWTMSSLPECFHERERLRGPVAALRPKFPPTTERVRPPSEVFAGECTIVVRDHELWISRGADRLRVPPQADLYRTPGGLTLVYIHGTQAEIRRY